MLEVLRCLEVECQAVLAEHAAARNHILSSKESPSSVVAAAAEALLSETRALQEILGGDPSTMSSCLRALHDEVSEGGGSGEKRVHASNDFFLLTLGRV